MSDTSLRKLAVFPSVPQADQVRAALESQGVPAFVDGAHAGTALAHTGGVGVFVSARDLEQARQVLARTETPAPLDTAELPWYCGKCREMVDADFDVCWSCAEVRDNVEQPVPAEVANDDTWSDSGERGGLELPGPSANPYQSPMLGGALQPFRPAATSLVEETVWRAWRASVIGLVIFPIVMHVYSIMLLIHATGQGRFSAKVRRRFYWSWAIDAAAITGWALVLRVWLG